VRALLREGAGSGQHNGRARECGERALRSGCGGRVHSAGGVQASECECRGGEACLAVLEG
jgi:hypothetical protein